jgi:hypothetical protein
VAAGHGFWWWRLARSGAATSLAACVAGHAAGCGCDGRVGCAPAGRAGGRAAVVRRKVEEGWGRATRWSPPFLSLFAGCCCVATPVVGALDPPPGGLVWGLCSERALRVAATCAGVADGLGARWSSWLRLGGGAGWSWPRSEAPWWRCGACLTASLAVLVAGVSHQLFVAARRRGTSGVCAAV